MNGLKYGGDTQFITMNAGLQLQTIGGSEYLIQDKADGTYNVVKIKGHEVGYIENVTIHYQTGERAKEFDPQPITMGRIAPGDRIHFEGKNGVYIITARVEASIELNPIGVKKTSDGIALTQRQ